MWHGEKDLVWSTEDGYADTSVLSIFIPPGAAARVVIDSEMFWIFVGLYLASCIRYKHTSAHTLCTQLHVNGFHLHSVFASQLFDADIQAVFKQAHRLWMRTCSKVIQAKSLKQRRLTLCEWRWVNSHKQNLQLWTVMLHTYSKSPVCCGTTNGFSFFSLSLFFFLR